MSGVTVPASELTAQELYLLGRKVEQEKHADAEEQKLGTLRGGNSGCITPDGEVYGACHRKALARYKGYQPPIEPISYTWFDAGFANEEAWMQKMEAAVEQMGPEYTLKAEEECPIVWEAQDGVKVTGRPDIMLFKDGAPILGLELKVVCAANSAIGIYCENKPKIANLIQAAHYSMAHGCPFTLVYSFRSRSAAPGWASKFKDKLRLSYEKTFTNSKTGRSFTKREYTIEPFTKEFRIGFDEGKVYYLTEDGTRVDTPLTEQGIRDYYDLIVRMDKDRDLHTRITQMDLAGNMLPYDVCNYCEFKDACDQFENDYDAWFDKVKLICEEEQ